MKNKFKCLIGASIPTILSLTPVVCLTSCNKETVYKDVPKDWLHIETLPDGRKVLLGFADEYQDGTLSLGDCNRLVIPKEVDFIENYAFKDCVESAKNKILAIECEDDCKCASFGNRGFINFVNLKSVVFPKGFDKWSSDLFEGCEKICNLDFRKVACDQETKEQRDWFKGGLPTIFPFAQNKGTIKYFLEKTKSQQTSIHNDNITTLTSSLLEVLHRSGSNTWKSYYEYIE